MKPGDAVLVEATLEYAGAGFCGVTLLAEGGHELMGGVPLSAVHALPDQATRRRAAELADDPSAFEGSVADWHIVKDALRLLAGNAAEDKPAAQSADAEGQGP